MMGKEEEDRLLEAIDPRFAGVYSKKRKNEDKCTSSGHQNDLVTKAGCESNNSDDKFRDMLVQQLSSFLEKNIKFVLHDDSYYSPLPVEGGIRLFSHSQILCSLEMDEEEKTAKHRKKERVLFPKLKEKLTKEEKERRLEEAAVTYEWVLEQSKIYNSL